MTTIEQLKEKKEALINEYAALRNEKEILERKLLKLENADTFDFEAIADVNFGIGKKQEAITKIAFDLATVSYKIKSN